MTKQRVWWGVGRASPRPARAGECPCRKEREPLSGARGFDQTARIADSLLAVETFDEGATDASQKRSDEVGALKLCLGDEAYRVRERRHQDAAIEIARMVRHDDTGGIGRGESFQSLP